MTVAARTGREVRSLAVIAYWTWNWALVLSSTSVFNLKNSTRMICPNQIEDRIDPL